MKYTFSHPASLIKDVEIYAAGKQLQAVLYAPENGNPKQLATLKRKMEENGFDVLADTESGEDVLRLRGFKTADKLLTSLADDGGVFGNYGVQITEREVKEKKGVGDLIKDNSLTLSGVFYVLADSLVIFSGAMRKDIPEIFNGVLWWIPSFFLMAAGNQNPDVVQGFLQRDILEELDKSNIKVPTEALQVLQNGAVGRGNWDKIVELVYEHGPILNNVMQMLGGSQMAAAGLNQKNAGKVAAGTLVFLGMGAGALLPEPEQNTYASVGLGAGELKNPDMLRQTTLNYTPGQSRAKLTEAQQRSEVLAPEAKKGIESHINPLAYSGGLAAANNFLNIYGAGKELLKFFKGTTWGVFLGKGRTTYKDADGIERPLQSNKWFKQEINNLEAKQQSFRDRIGTMRQSGTNSGDVYEELLGIEKLYGDKLKSLETEYKKAERSANASFLNLGASGLYLIANGLYAISSKENKADLDQIGGVNTVITVCANIIASHPKEEQAPLKERLAMMLSQNKYVDFSVQDVAAVLDEKVQALSGSAWMGNAGNNMQKFVRKQAVQDGDAPNKPANKIVEARHQLVETLTPKKRETSEKENSKKELAGVGAFSERLNTEVNPDAGVTIH